MVFHSGAEHHLFIETIHFSYLSRFRHVSSCSWGAPLVGGPIGNVLSRQDILNDQALSFGGGNNCGGTIIHGGKR